MAIARKLATATGTAAFALGIGFYMQHGAKVPQSEPLVEPAPVAQVDLQTEGAAPSEFKGVSRAAMALDLSDISLSVVLAPDEPAPAIPAMAPPEPAKVVPIALHPIEPADTVTPVTPQRAESTAQSCEVRTQISVQDHAMVTLDLNASCYPNERLTVHHQGMMFTETTDAQGKLALTVPALSEQAVFILAFANGKGAVAKADVPDLKTYDRVVLQWSSDAAFQLHAREFGATYGESGHVWSGEDAQNSVDGGFVTRLGRTDTLVPQLAEVYSFPTGTASRAGSVALSVETEVTQANCGRDVGAQTLEFLASGTMRTRDLVLSVPDCSAIGDFLVLNNLLDDLKIAGN